MRKVSRLIFAGVLLCVLIILAGGLALVFGRIDKTVEAGGAVMPARQVGICPEITGIIRECFVKCGDRLAVGDTVLILASDELDYQVRRAGLAVAEATVRLLESTEEYSNLTMSESFEGSAVLGDINAARKRMELAKTGLDRAEKLWNDQLLSAEERDAVKLTYDLALSNYRVLEARKSMLEKQYLRQIEERRSALDLAERACDLARQRLDKSVVLSPVSGMVLTSDTDNLAGTIASEGRPVIRIGDMSTMQFVAHVSENDIPEIRVGLSARIFINAYPHREYRIFNGRVAEISATPQITGAGVSFETRLDIEDPWVEQSASRVDLRPGLTGRVEIVIEPRVRIMELILEGLAK